MNILISSAGRRVSLVSYFRRELRRLCGEASNVFTCDLKPELAPACQLSDRAFVVPRLDDQAYVTTLLDLCIANQINMIVPTIDAELPVLSRNRARFETQDIRLIVSDQNLVNSCRNKKATRSLFLQHRFLVPDEVDPHVPRFPLFVKPISGSSSQDIVVVRSASQLSEYLCDTERFVHQEYLSPHEHEEYTVDLYYDRNSILKCAVPRRRIEVRGGEVSKGITDKQISERLLGPRLFRLEGARGCLTLQLFLNKSSQDVFAIEINPRFGGGYPLSYLAGANFPEMLIREYLLGDNLEFYDAWEDQLLLLRYDSELVIHAT